MAARNKSGDSLSVKDSRRTPLAFFRWLDSIFHFGMDLACTTENKLCEHGLTFPEVDSLDTLWMAHAVDHELNPVGYCNPPYSSITPWIQKAIVEAAQGFTTVFFIPSLNGEARDELLIEHAQICNVIGRVNFPHAVTGKVGSNERGTMIAVISPKHWPELPKGIRRDWVLENFSE